MECKFVVGQKVVCVNDEALPNNTLEGLCKGEIYTVRTVFFESRAPGRYQTGKSPRPIQITRQGPCITVRELTREDPEEGWYADRFRPLQEVDLSIFEKMLAKDPLLNELEIFKSEVDELITDEDLMTPGHS